MLATSWELDLQELILIQDVTDHINVDKFAIDFSSFHIYPEKIFGLIYTDILGGRV